MADPLANRRSSRRAHVTVVGLGGLGCPAASGLAAAGMDVLTLVDPDRVELSNLPRQLLHGESDIGRFKVDSAADTLLERHPDMLITRVGAALTADNAADIFAAADFVIDATDGGATKLMINDAAVGCGRPYCHAGVLGFSGQLMTVIPGQTPCLRCVFPDLDPGAEETDASCREAGIVGPVAGLIGALQASQALAYLAGADRIGNRLFAYDGLTDRWRDLDIAAVARCAVCAEAGRQAARPQGERPQGEHRWAT